MDCSVCHDIGMVTTEDKPRPWMLPLEFGEAAARLTRIVLGLVPGITAQPCTVGCRASEGVSSPSTWQDWSDPAFYAAHKNDPQYQN